MKTSLRTLTAALVLAGFAAGPASAMVSQADSGFSTNGPSNVNYYIDGSTVTISGWVESGSDRYKLEQAAAGFDGVDRVINLVTQSN
jgi:hypothetical protein